MHVVFFLCIVVFLFVVVFCCCFLLLCCPSGIVLDTDGSIGTLRSRKRNRQELTESSTVRCEQGMWALVREEAERGGLLGVSGDSDLHSL